MSKTPISWLGTLIPMLSVTDHTLLTTRAFPLVDEVAFYVSEATLVTWIYDVETSEVTRYVTATDDGVDLLVTTWDLTHPDTFSNAFQAMVMLSLDLAEWSRLP